MKLKILTIASLSLSTLALFQPQSDVGTCNNLYLQKQDCDKQFSNSCLSVDRCEYSKLSSTQEDDTSKPIKTKNEVVACVESKTNIETCQAVADDPETTEVDESLSIEQDCQNKFEAKICAENFEKLNEGTQVSCYQSVANNCQAIISSKTCADTDEYVANLDNEVYCEKITGYEQKTTYFTEIDLDKKTAYEQRLQVEAGIKLAQQRIDHGKKVVALMVYRNALKGNLTEAQIETMVATYSNIKSLLETGSLNTAKTKISELTADGTLVTEADKTALISEINLFGNL